jgi:hypothetical protein
MVNCMFLLPEGSYSPTGPLGLLDTPRILNEEPNDESRHFP